MSFNVFGGLSSQQDKKTSGCRLLTQQGGSSFQTAGLNCCCVTKLISACPDVRCLLSESLLYVQWLGTHAMCVHIVKVICF